jgi:hypothetical protein
VIDKQMVLSVIALLTALTYVHAHEDYEYKLSSVVQSAGGTTYVALHYRDGIIGADPVKLRIYDRQGRIIAETPYYRDVVYYVRSAGRIDSFGMDVFSLFFSDSWTIMNGDIVPNYDETRYLYFLLATLRFHWFGYFFSLLIIAGPTVLSLFNRSRPSTSKRTKWVHFLVALIWLGLVFLHGRLSVLLVFLVWGLFIFPLLLLRLRGGDLRDGLREERRLQI